MLAAKHGTSEKESCRPGVPMAFRHDHEEGFSLYSSVCGACESYHEHISSNPRRKIKDNRIHVHVCTGKYLGANTASEIKLLSSGGEGPLSSHGGRPFTRYAHAQLFGSFLFFRPLSSPWQRQQTKAETLEI